MTSNKQAFPWGNDERRRVYLVEFDDGTSTRIYTWPSLARKEADIVAVHRSLYYKRVIAVTKIKDE
jgi:hypothetical protein